MSSPKDPQNQHIWRKASISDSSCPHKPVTVRASPLWCVIFVLSPSLHSNARRWPPWCTDRRRSSAWRSLTPGGNSRCEDAWRHLWFKIKTNVYPLQFVHVDFSWITADKLLNMSPLSPQIPSFLIRLKPLSDIKYATVAAFVHSVTFRLIFRKISSLCAIFGTWCVRRREILSCCNYFFSGIKCNSSLVIIKL